MCISLLDPVVVFSGWILAVVGYMVASNVDNRVLGIIFLPLPSFFDIIIVTSYLVQKGREMAFKSIDIRDKYMYLVSAAVFMCFIADIILSWAGDSEVLFILGMVAFMIVHILLITAYSVNGEPLMLRRLFLVFLLAAPSIVYLFVACGLLSNVSLAIAIVIYAALEGVMCWRALSRVGFKPNEENISAQWVVAIGALLFVGSDILLVMRKFCTTFPQDPIYRDYYISLYFLGVLGIALGANRFENPVKYFFQSGGYVD